MEPIARGVALLGGHGVAWPAVRVAFLEGPDAGLVSSAVADCYGLVLENGRAFWCGDDLTGVAILEADTDELVLLEAAAIVLPWLE